MGHADLSTTRRYTLPTRPAPRTPSPPTGEQAEEPWRRILKQAASTPGFYREHGLPVVPAPDLGAHLYVFFIPAPSGLV